MGKRYFWLKLKEDFFQQDAIEWLEEQQNGKSYVLFYLKLCLKSLGTNGMLIREVGEMRIPYSVPKLAKLTHTNPDTAGVALKVLTDIGMVKRLENGALFIPEVCSMVGSESAEPNALRQKRLRDKRKEESVTQSVTKGVTGGVTHTVTQSVTNSNADIDIDKELDLDIELEQEQEQEKDLKSKADATTNTVTATVTVTDNKKNIENSNIFLLWERNVSPLTEIIAGRVISLIEEVGEATVEQAIVSAVEHGARNFAYIQAAARGIASGCRRPSKGEMPF